MERKDKISSRRIVRSTMKSDILYFGIPGLIVFTLGLGVCATTGYTGMVSNLIQIISDPGYIKEVELNKIIGTLIFLLGLSYAITAVSTLKKSYSSTLVVREKHKLVKHGVFTLSRHPVYLGVLTSVIIGIPVFSWSLLGFLILSALIPIFLNRIRMEEKLLIEEFGNEYKNYIKTTKKLIPFIF